MHITWLGLSALKIETKEAVIVMDPFNPAMAAKPMRAKADIVTMSDAQSPLASHIDAIQGEPFVIDSPGEYDLKGVFIQGIGTETAGDKAGGRTVNSCIVDAEGMRLVHLGLMNKMPSDEIIEKMDTVDILIVPVGGGDNAMSPALAAKAVSEIEPRIVIPVMYDAAGAKEKLLPVAAFLKEVGAPKEAPMEKLLVKRKDIPEEEDTRVVVLKA